MEDRTIHPSMKTVWLAYGVVIAIIVVAIWAWFEFGQNLPPWVTAIPLILLVSPIRMHIQRRLVSLRLHDNHLTIESGLLSRTRRTIDMAKIQDVTVRQTLGQRMLGVGDLSLESAGERSSMGLQNLDNPRQLADEIIASSKRALQARGDGTTIVPKP